MKHEVYGFGPRSDYLTGIEDCRFQIADWGEGLRKWFRLVITRVTTKSSIYNRKSEIVLVGAGSGGSLVSSEVGLFDQLDCVFVSHSVCVGRSHKGCENWVRIQRL